MYEEITESKGCIDAIESAFGTSHAEQAAHLYEDHEDLDQYSDGALEEIEEYLIDRFEEDSDAMYIVNRIHVIRRLIEEAEAVAAVVNQKHTIRLQMKLDAQIALAVGSEREELLPTAERVAQSFQPDENTTPNEAALMRNLEGWINMAVEASRALIQFKQKAGKLQQEAEEREENVRALRSYIREGKRGCEAALRQLDGMDQ